MNIFLELGYAPVVARKLHAMQVYLDDCKRNNIIPTYGKLAELSGLDRKAVYQRLHERKDRFDFIYLAELIEEYHR